MSNSLLNISSPQAFMVSFLLLLGLFNLGRLICGKILSNEMPVKEFHYSLFGLIVISIPIYFSSLYNFYLDFLYLAVSIMLIILGFHQFIIFIKDYKLNFIKKNLKKFYSITFIVIVLILISQSPATNADSIDYHYGIAYQILNLGFYPNPINMTWLHGYFGGIIEPTIGLGLFLGSDSFGANQQIIAVLSIVGTIFGIKKKYIYKKEEIFIILSLILGITPLLFFFSSAKPQLIGVASNLLAFIFIFNLKNSYEINNKITILIFTLIVFAFLVKFTFIISSSLLYIFFLYKCLNIKKIKLFIFNSLIIFLILVLPFILWKIRFLDYTIIESFLYPIPISIPGMNNFLDYLRGHHEFTIVPGKDNLERIFYLKIFPIFLLIPSGFEKSTTFIGIPLLFLLFYKKNNKKEIIELRIFILILYVLTAILSSPNTRYYLLIYYLGVIHLLLCGINFKSIYFKYLYPLLKFHLFIYMLMLSYALYAIVPGIFNNNLRHDVLNNNAIYYNVAKIVEDKIPKKSRIINDFRSTALFPFHQVRTDWIENISINSDNKDKINFYLRKIIEFKPDYLITNDTNNKMSSIIRNCVTLEFQINDIKVSTRNPFYKDKNYIKLSIYKIKDLNRCLIK